MVNPMDIGTISGKAIFVLIHHLLNMIRCDFCGINDHATKLTSRVLTSERQIPDLAKLFLSADQINLYFIQLFVFIWQFSGTY
jgi:hypothetical protein